MHQLGFSDYVAGRRPPMARRRDPLSSHAAADRMERSGAAKAQRERVLEAIKATPGLTSRELAERHGMDRHMVGRRCSELERAGLAFATERDGDDLRWWPEGHPVPPGWGERRKRP